jgi:hypothetical protein
VKIDFLCSFSRTERTRFGWCGFFVCCHQKKTQQRTRDK